VVPVVVVVVVVGGGGGRKAEAFNDQDAEHIKYK